MPVSVGWFIGLASIATLSLSMGWLLGRGPAWSSRTAITVALALMIGWAWLQHHPALAVDMMPVSVLSYLEGVAAVPVFMLVVGIVWARSHLRRQKRLAILAVGLGAVYFVQGSLWMIQTSPSKVLGNTVLSHGIVMQTQDFSCVPAACATALNQIGIHTTEAEMADLTYTRPGTGATLIRAMNGLNRRLEGTDLHVELTEPTFEQLAQLPLPALTPLQFEPTRRHMVVIRQVGPGGVLIADPSGGIYMTTRPEFEEAFVGQVLVFHGPGRPTVSNEY